MLAWRDSVARGLLDGPMIFTSGPKIEGKNSIWPGDTEVETRAGVDSALDNLQRLRVDFVKLTDNTLKPELFRYALGEIRRRGMKSSAHIPSGVPVREAVELGLGSIEHLSYAIRGASEGIPSGAGRRQPAIIRLGKCGGAVSIHGGTRHRAYADAQHQSHAGVARQRGPHQGRIPEVHRTRTAGDVFLAHRATGRLDAGSDRETARELRVHRARSFRCCSNRAC